MGSAAAVIVLSRNKELVYGHARTVERDSCRSPSNETSELQLDCKRSSAMPGTSESPEPRMSSASICSLVRPTMCGNLDALLIPRVSQPCALDEIATLPIRKHTLTRTSTTDGGMSVAGRATLTASRWRGAVDSALLFGGSTSSGRVEPATENPTANTPAVTVKARSRGLSSTPLTWSRRCERHRVGGQPARTQAERSVSRWRSSTTRPPAHLA